jgi:nucleoside-diphosphate-sugar epimerase
VLSPLRSFKASQAVPRMLADFVNVHVCMVVALAMPVLSLMLTEQGMEAGERLRLAIRYYSHNFVWLALLFPAVFLMNGFYTRSRAYAGRYKYLVILRGVGLGILLLIATNFLFFQQRLPPRSATVMFYVLTMASLVISRMVKTTILDRFEIKPKARTYPRSQSDGVTLVLGGAGYIGSCLVRKLLASNKKVRVMDSLVYGGESIREVIGHPNLELQIGDCRKIQDLVAAVKDIDSIVHLAAIVGDPACEVDPQISQEINYAATRMLIEVAKGNGVRRLVFASSCSVYGATDLLMDEFSNVRPVSLYGQTKVDSERSLLMGQSKTFHPILLRFATVFGLSYRPRFDLVVNLLAAKACQEGAINIFNGSQWRPFIHVQDAAESIIQVLKAPLEIVGGEIYNVGDSRLNFTLSDVAHKILSAFPSTRVEYIQNADHRNYRVSFEKIRNQIGFQCSYTLEDGISEIRRAFEQKQIVDYTDPRYYNQQYLTLTGSRPCKDELDTNVMAALVRPVTPASQPVLVPAARAAAAGR